MPTTGRPPWQPTLKDRDTVRTMTAVGIPQDQICAVLKINLKTLRRHCRQELDCGATEANAMVGQSMFRMATAGPYSVRFQAAKYWLACRAGWRDVERPMSLAALVPVSAMSNEELNAVLRVNGLPAIDDPDPSPLTAPTGTDAIVPFPRRPPRGGR